MSGVINRSCHAFTSLLFIAPAVLNIGPATASSTPTSGSVPDRTELYGRAAESIRAATRPADSASEPGVSKDPNVPDERYPLARGVLVKRKCRWLRSLSAGAANAAAAEGPDGVDNGGLAVQWDKPKAPFFTIPPGFPFLTPDSKGDFVAGKNR